MEEKDLQRLLDMLYGMIDEAKSAPFSAERCTINRDEALDILTEIRSRMPLEIKKAQELIRAREEYIASAKKEVEKMLRQADLDAKTIVSESETLQRARMKSAEIIHRAEERTSSIGWPTPTPRMPCAAPRRPFRWLWTRCASPGSASGPPPTSKCSKSAAAPPLSRRKSRRRMKKTDKICGKIS